MSTHTFVDLHHEKTTFVGPNAPTDWRVQVGTLWSDTTANVHKRCTSISPITFVSTEGGGSGITDGDKGDVVVSAGGTVWLLDNDVVTYAKMQNVSATDRFLGRKTSGAGDVEELTGAEATARLDVFTTSLKGLAPSSGGGTANFLRADGTWAAPPGGSGAPTFAGVSVFEEFLTDPLSQAGVRYGSAASYFLANINGTGSLGVPGINAVMGVWRLTSGATTGNISQCQLWAPTANDPIVAPNATQFTLEVRAKLENTAQKSAIGVYNIAGGGGASFNNAGTAIYFVYDGTNWNGVVKRFGSGTTNVTFSPTQAGDTNWHLFKVEVTSSLVTFYMDGTSVGTASTSANIPNVNLGLAFEIECTSNTARHLDLDGWRYEKSTR